MFFMHALLAILKSDDGGITVMICVWVEIVRTGSWMWDVKYGMAVSREVFMYL